MNPPVEPEAAKPFRVESAVVCKLPYEEAYLMAGRLVSEGIPARVDPPDYASYYGKMLHPTFDVLVERDRYDEARAVVDSISSA